MPDPSPQVLLVPGLGDSGPVHWQSEWQRAFGWARVRQSDPDRPVLAEWIATLDAAMRALAGPVVIAAHSLGCPLVAHWAAQAGDARVAGALLVAPADVEAPGALEEIRGFAPIPTAPLPFPSVVVASDDDPYVSAHRAEFLVGAWGARLERVGALGHVNADSGLGRWDHGLRLLAEVGGPAA
ncbi:MAG: alpha/beta hydrolase [Thermoleophilia bacterium]